MYDRLPGLKAILFGAINIVRSEQLSLIGCKKRFDGRVALASTLALTMIAAQFVLPALAEERTIPSGTLLLPLTPKLDPGSPDNTPSAIAPLPKKESRSKKKIAVSSSSATAKAIEVSTTTLIPKLDLGPASPVPPVEPPANSPEDLGKMLKKPSNTNTSDPDEPDISKIEDAEDNTLLKGTVQIVADDTEYDQLKNTFLGTGSAVATIAGQDARLEADMILYDQSSEMLDARGNVKIIRQGQVSTGSSFKFKVSSDEYLITSPDTAINNTEVIARTGYGAKDGIRFREGTMQMPAPVHISRNLFNGTMNSVNESFQKTIHPDAYTVEKPSFVFKARKMTYEKYKETGNLTVFGGKLMFGKFGVPLGKFTATVGQGDQAHVTFPMTPFISNNLMVGGINVGPLFNTALPGDKIFSWAPLIQYGGRLPGKTDRSNVGAGFRMSFRGKKLSANLAYGSVSNLLVGDVKYKINQRDSFQGGINRYLPAGLFGAQRARAIGEFVDTRGIGGIPFIQGISFRSAFGAASDNPALLNQSPQYRQLFSVNHTGITNAFRLQEQAMGSTQPIFALGNQKVGMTSNLFGGVSAAGYSTGDHLFMGEIGPVANVYLDRLRFSTSMMKAAVNGQSPFIFDQYLQGSTSSQLGGSYKVCKYLDIGGNLGYNMDNKLFYQKQVSAAIGPEDFKFLISHDTIRGINRFGFDMIYGQPIPFNKLIMKTAPDVGQLSGM